MTAAESLAPTVGRAPACRALGIPRASFYRTLGRRNIPLHQHPGPHPPAPWRTGLPCCWPMNPLAIWMRTAAAALSHC